MLVGMLRAPALAGTVTAFPRRTIPEHTLLMNSREERMAKNEAASREINEEIEHAYQGESRANRIDIVCECARMTCDAAIDITLDEYRHVRMDPRQFAVVPEHFIGDIERIVYENDRFAVVAKREGISADVASDDNPRG
jgi:hypothetical protein